MESPFIISIISHLEQCGPVNVLYDIIRHQDIKNHCIITLKPENENSLIDKFQKLGVTIIQTKSSKSILFNLINARETLTKLIGDNGNTIVHAHGLLPMLVASTINQAKKITTTHCLSIEDFSMSHGPVKGRMFSCCYNHLVKKFDRCITISSKTTSYYQTYNTNIECIFNGINTKKYVPCKKTRQAIRQTFDIHDNDLVYVVCGKLIARKKTRSVIESFIKQYGKSVSHYLFIVGDGPELEQCRHIASFCDNIIITGFTTNPLPYLQASDILISNSSSEGLPLAILEGISCGLYPQLSNIQPHTDILHELCPKQIDISDFLLSDALSPVITKKDIYHNTLKQFRSTMLDKFSSEAMSIRYLKTYNSLA